MTPVAWNLFPTGTATTVTGEPGRSRDTVLGSSLEMSIMTIRPSSLLRNRFGFATPYTLPRRVRLTQRPSSPRAIRGFSSGRMSGAAAGPAVGGAGGTTAAGASRAEEAEPGKPAEWSVRTFSSLYSRRPARGKKRLGALAHSHDELAVLEGAASANRTNVEAEEIFRRYLLAFRRRAGPDLLRRDYPGSRELVA